MFYIFFILYPFIKLLAAFIKLLAVKKGEV